MTPRPWRRAAIAAMIVGYMLHTVTAILVWRTWGSFGRGNVLAWIDFPISLAYLHLDGVELLSWSLLGGGIQWGLIAALLSTWLGSTVRRA